VRLRACQPRLGPAKGIEDAVSVTALFDLPCWATLGTERFASVNLPDQLTLFLDAHHSGRLAPNARGEGKARNELGLQRGKSSSFHASDLR
jgi:hypothetical protein